MSGEGATGSSREKKTKIARKLIFGIIIFSGMLSVIITAAQLYFEFQRDKYSIGTQLDAVKQTSLPSLNAAVWLSDKDQIEILLLSIQENQDISYVELTTDEGEIFQFGDQFIEDSLAQSFELVHEYNGLSQHIGKLLIKANLQKAYEHLYDRIGFVLISNTLKTLLVALFIYFLVHVIVIKHLVKIAEYVRTFNINDKTPLTLSRGRQGSQDELNSLEASVNFMTHNLNESVQKLMQSEEKNRLLLKSTAEAIFGIDLNGNCIFANPACFKVIGYQSEEELLGKNMHELIHHTRRDGTHYPCSECQIGAAINNNQSVHVDDEVFWRKDGTAFDVEYRAQPIYQNARVTGAVISFFDITEQLAIMQQLREARQQAEVANVAKGNFLANMSHEIRTPMNAILGMANLALNAGPDEAQRRYLNRIDSAATSLLRIINDILDFSKIEAGKLEMEETGFRLSNVINNVMNITGGAAKQKQLDLTVSLDEGIAPVLTGDPLRLNQVLLNLVNNAIKFTETGRITIDVVLQQVLNERVELMFRVRDTGIGLSEKQKAQLFGAFSQADSSTTRQYGGSGLGLTISKTLVELMEGEIGVESSLSAGSMFYFNAWFGVGTEAMLPSRDDLQPDVNPAELRAKVRGAHILLVEDNDINQEVAIELLTKSGIQVDVANNGQEAVNKLGNGQEYDGVLMDIQMPVMDGYEATNTIRREKKLHDLPIIAMTANAMQGDREKCLDAGMNDYISKPVNGDELFSIMARWITPKHPALDGDEILTSNHEQIAFPELPGVDIHAGLDNVEQNRALYRRLLVKLRECHGDFVQCFRNARREDDIKTARRLAHTFKSALATVGAKELSVSASVLEQMVDATGQDNAVNAQLALIEDRFPKLVAAIDSLTSGDISTPNQSTPVPGALLALLQRMQGLLKARDTCSRDLVEEVMVNLQHTPYIDDAREIKRHVEKYQFKPASSTLAELMNKLTDAGH